MSFQGKEFTSEVKQIVVNLKLFFDKERKNHRVVSTRNPAKRTAEGLGIGEASVKRIMAEYRQHDQKIIDKPLKQRGKPEYNASVNLQPVIRQYIRSKNMAGQRVGIEKLRDYLIREHEADIPHATLWRTLKRWGFIPGTGKRISALKERNYVVLARRRLIIMDNARYHNVLAKTSFPNLKSRKEQLCLWLTRNHIPWNDDMLKPELFELCKRFAPAPELELDKIADAAGHTILRTPQYHPELQPIESCWGVVKNYMAAHCDFTMASFRSNLPIAHSKVASKTCRKLISKIAQKEEKYWTEDNQLYDSVEIEELDSDHEEIYEEFED
jgi:hypothetical protein